jgi:hypothetical protein
MIGFGLAFGLWVAANVWFYRYAVGYRAGVKMCTEQLEPVKAEIASMLASHHVSEAMRQAIRLKMLADEPEEPRETRH